VPACDVLLCHCPPARTPLDRVYGRGVHVGSEAIRERALSHQGFLVCGHIHEAAGATQLGQCLCLNAGGLGRPFGKTQVGYIVRDGDQDLVGHEDLKAKKQRWWGRGPDEARVLEQSPLSAPMR